MVCREMAVFGCGSSHQAGGERESTLDLHPHLVHDKAIDVSGLLHLLRQRLAATVTGLGVDTDEDRGLASLALLQRGSKLEGVGRHNTIVMVGRGDKGSRISHTGLQIV